MTQAVLWPVEHAVVETVLGLRVNRASLTESELDDLTQQCESAQLNTGANVELNSLLEMAIRVLEPEDWRDGIEGICERGTSTPPFAGGPNPMCLSFVRLFLVVLSWSCWGDWVRTRRCMHHMQRYRSGACASWKQLSAGLCIRTRRHRRGAVHSARALIMAIPSDPSP